MQEVAMDPASDQGPARDSIPSLLELAENLTGGDHTTDDFDLLLIKLARDLHRRYLEIHRLDQITEHINAGLVLDEVLDNVYESFREIIPYDRIGFTIIDEESQTMVARWSRSDTSDRHLFDNYSEPLEGSELLNIIRSHEPKIINDITTEPDPTGTRPTELLLREGIRSLMTCPLIANGVPIGFLFFSSSEPNVYEPHHVEVFKKLASRLSIIVEKGRLVTEIVEHEEAIEAQNEELLRLNEMRNAFLGMAAHDMRNPLGSILMAVDLLEGREDLDDDERWMLDAIRERSQYMLTLINDLLDVSKVEAGELTLKPELVELEGFLRDVALDLNHMYASKGTTIVVEPEATGTVTTDPHRLRQVLENLLSNAVKYSPPGSTVTLRLAPQPADGWRIAVLDEGPGISPEERDRLFQPFSRISTQPTGGEASTGLGLAITQRVVEALGGEIGVRDNIPTGSEFWFTLPAD
jgi:K+-sensing histidine kinase KdpD